MTSRDSLCFKMIVIRFGIIGHDVLSAFWQLIGAHNGGRGPVVDGKGWDDSVLGQDRAIGDATTVFEDTMFPDHHIWPDIDVRSDGSRIYYGTRPDVNMISDRHGQECDSFVEFLEGWPDDCSTRDDTIPANLDICQVSSDRAPGLYDRLVI